MTYKPLPRIIEEIAPSQVVINDVLTNIYYDFGVAIEVVNRLKLKTTDPILRAKKYPLIWFLIQDSVKEDIDYRKNPVRNTNEISIIICTETEKGFTSAERYDNVILPILRPIYDSFIINIKKSKLVKSKTKFFHEYSENLFWGANGLYGHIGNIFDDNIDAIIIENLDLSIVNNC